MDDDKPSNQDKEPSSLSGSLLLYALMDQDHCLAHAPATQSPPGSSLPGPQTPDAQD